ncbi:hypothetical protein FBQ97_03005, partial [Acidobacteria bacterium ACD]|nr:hypothetical protein [Acidobacteria bacterium ACD]
MSDAGSLAFVLRRARRLGWISGSALAAHLLIAGSAARGETRDTAAPDGARADVLAAPRASAVPRPAVDPTPPLTLTTLAGPESGPGWFDGTGSAARFSLPTGVAFDAAGNAYVSDRTNQTIRKVSPAGVVSTLAGLEGTPGSSDGRGAAARFNAPWGVAVDSLGNVFVADMGNSTIRKVAPDGMVTTLAGLAGTPGSTDGTGAAARFSSPQGPGLLPSGDLLVADSGNHTIRKVTPAGVVTTLAGLAGTSGSADGTGTVARFLSPSAVCVDTSGNAYVADIGNSTIRRAAPDGTVTTIAGLALNQGSADGTGTDARFRLPSGVAVDVGGNVYVADMNNQTIRKVTSTGVVSTLAGQVQTAGWADGTGTAARFYNPRGVAVAGSGNVFVADNFNSTIREVTPAGVVTTFVGLASPFGWVDATGTAALFNSPAGVATDGSGNVYVADSSHVIRRVTSGGVVSTLAGLAGTSGNADGTGTTARFSGPQGVAVDSAGTVTVGDSYNHAIRQVSSAGVVTTLAGLPGTSGSADGTGTAARFYLPASVARDDGGNVYVADRGNHAIRVVTPGGVVTTLAGQPGTSGSVDGTGTAARFYRPQGVAVDAAGNVFVADTDNQTIRKVTPGGVVTTLAGLAGQRGTADGTGSTARFNGPWGIGVDGAGNAYVADFNNNTVRRVTPEGVVSTLLGLGGTPGNVSGTGSAARFFGPRGLALGPSGEVFVGDTIDNSLRVAATALPDVATIDQPSGLVGSPRQVDTSPQTATTWLWEVVRIPPGATATLSSTSVRNPTFTPDVAGHYDFRLTASDGTQTSITTVGLTAWVPPTAAVGGGGTVCLGQSASISATLTGDPPWSVTWSDGVTQSGLTTSPATRDVSPTSTTVYSVTAVSDANGAGTSSGSATVTVTGVVAPTATVSGTATICAGTDTTLSAVLTGTPPWSLTWSDGVTQSGVTASPAARTASPASTTVYTVTAVSDAGCTGGAAVGSATVTVDPAPATPVVTAPSSATAGVSGLTAFVVLNAGNTYSWTIQNGSLTAGQGTNAITFTAGTSGATVLTVVETNGAGCSASSVASIPIAEAEEPRVVNRWTKLGPDGGDVTMIAVDPTAQQTVWATAFSGVFKSMDGGENWVKLLPTPSAAYAVALHPVNAVVAFAADGSRRLFRTTDGGASWSQLGTGITAGNASAGSRIAFRPGDPSVMFYAAGAALFKSTDSGATWARSDGGVVTGKTVVDLSVDASAPDTLVLVLRDFGPHRSTDGGATWEPLTTGLPTTTSGSTTYVRVTAFAQDPGSPERMFVTSGHDGRVYATTDGGDSWTARSTSGIGAGSLLVAPGDGQTLYAGAADTFDADPTALSRIWKSTDAG